MIAKEAYSTKEAADLLEVRVATLNRAVWDGRVQPPSKLGRSFLWKPIDIERASWALRRKSADDVLEKLEVTTHS